MRNVPLVLAMALSLALPALGLTSGCTGDPNDPMTWAKQLKNLRTQKEALDRLAFDDTDDPLMVVFPTGAPRPLPEVSFLLGRLAGQRVERVRLVFAPELRDDIRRALAN